MVTMTAGTPSSVLPKAAADASASSLAISAGSGPSSLARFEVRPSTCPLVLMMFVTAVMTGLINVLFIATGLMGASGIVFMMILLSSFTNIRTGEIPLTFILVVLIYLAREVVNAFDSDSISQFAHIAGGVCGSAFGFFFSRRPPAQLPDDTPVPDA